MTEFELDDESVGRSKGLAERLVSDVSNVVEGQVWMESPQEFFSARRYANFVEGVPFEDVTMNVSNLANEVALATQMHGRIPCVSLGGDDIAILSFRDLFPFPFGQPMMFEEWRMFWGRYMRYPMREFWHDMERSLMQSESKVRMLEWGEARKYVEQGLQRFLSYRFAGIKAWQRWSNEVGEQKKPRGGEGGPREEGPPRGGPPRRDRPPRDGQPPRKEPPPPPPPDDDASLSGSPSGTTAGGGLQVRVSCRTRGLRIHFAPAYFINWSFFGHPSTPVTSYLPPGRYVFAGDGSMLVKRTQDNGVFDIPPTFHAHLNKF